ncbi:unnamed protein product [Candidula unifasciata]|uniref:High-affinity choline transporter 1 n=1 Tax=Candidula unifasciata TaxID=100452 RepID=A0A8S3Z4X5_9EUPU|nr:unnamed protein product [Candidula unifasciata]
MSVDIAGLVSVIVFYVAILVVGLWAARKTGFRTKNLKIDDVMLANRSIGVFMGTFTMTATWVGGGYINGTTEVVAAAGGLVWCQAPVGYAISLIFGGLFFSDKMRDSGFTTMLDPFHWKYGDLMNCLLYLPAVCGDIFWSAAILAALGASLKVILDMNLELAIIVSAAIACVYTLLGGLYSVAYTDVIQLICMFIGLWLCIPFSMTHDAVKPITSTSSVWLGELNTRYIANYIDFGLLLICGGIPWQVYWQRALAAKSSQVARWLSYMGSVGCILMAIPSVLMGAVAASTDWNNTDYGHSKISANDTTLILPLVMRYLCPPAVTFIGLGAVSAAVMSSTDSSVLSSSSMFARNVFGVMYARIHKVKVSETAQVWVMRLAQVVITVLACYMAISVSSIYRLWILCSDFVYVILFPQLVCVMYIRDTNSYGSFAAFVLGLLFRLLGGDASLGIPAAIKYPWYDEESNTQLFPYRTLSMLISMVTLITVSFMMRLLPLSLDKYGCFQVSCLLLINTVWGMHV